MSTTIRREQVLQLLRLERTQQVERYGDNADTPMGFGGSLSAHPWLLPYSDATNEEIQKGFREDYEIYENINGQPTWMHLIREEVAELFDARTRAEAIDEAVQVAALCVSLVEQLLAHEGEPL